MTAIDEFDRQLDVWFEERATSTPPDGLLERSLSRVKATRQRPAWLVRDSGVLSRGPRRPGSLATIPQRSKGVSTMFGKGPRLEIVAAAALLVAVLVGGAIAVGAGLLRPSVVPPTPAPSLNLPTALPSAESSPRHTNESSVPATWRTTGPMIEMLGGPTSVAESADKSATLLRDGTVFVAGGIGDAERFNPSTGTWSRTGPMGTHRRTQTATLLVDGRVLVAGGTGDDGSDLSAAELFDPIKGRWTATGSMSAIRSGHTATLLQGGRVLVTGGLSTDRTYRFPHLASAEIYDPTRGVWTGTGNMTQARWGHTATLLPDGKVLVTGGAVFPPNGSNKVFASAELYDPNSGRWTATGSLSEARVGHSAILLGNGKVLVLGGSVNGSGGGSPSAEMFDPGDGRWAAAANMTTVRSDYSVTLLRDGRLLVAGGVGGALDGAQIPLASAELFDPRDGSWTATAPMTTARTGHFAVLLGDGSVLVSGGSARDPNRNGAFIGLVASELYHPGVVN